MARPKSHPEAEALYRAILAHPDEDTPRLVFADWLQENGDSERAEFIRLQCRLARMSEWDDGYTADRVRAERLQRELGEKWWLSPGEAPRPGAYHYTNCRPIRGFPGRVVFTPKVTAEQARAWFAPRPIAEAEYHFGRAYGDDLQLWRLATDALPGLRALTLNFEYDCSLEGRAEVCRALATTAARSGLTRLEIVGNPTPEGLEAVINSPHLRGLEALSVRGEGVGDSHARVLAERMNLPALRELALMRVRGLPSFTLSIQPGLTSTGAAALAGAGWFARLHTLRLAGHDDLDDTAMGTLFGHRELPELQALHVENCGAHGGVLRSAGSRNLPGLVELRADSGRPTVDELLALSAGPQQFRSVDLGLRRGVEATFLLNPGRFFAGPAVRDLRRLVWQSASELGYLAASPVARSLRWLEVDDRWSGDPTASLLAAPEWPHLERLVVSNASMSGESLLALIAGEKFPRLLSIKAHCRNGNVTVFLRKLAKCPAAARLCELDLHAQLTTTSARALIGSPYLVGIERLTLNKGAASPGDCERLVERYGARVQIAGFEA